MWNRSGLLFHSCLTLYHICFQLEPYSTEVQKKEDKLSSHLTYLKYKTAHVTLFVSVVGWQTLVVASCFKHDAITVAQLRARIYLSNGSKHCSLLSQVLFVKVIMQH